jgi:hypothetical protein
MRRPIAVGLLAVVGLFAAASAEAQHTYTGSTCNHKCQFKRDQQKLREATDRNPVPSYIVSCESGGNYRAINTSSGAGGKYQILPSTWQSEISKLRHYIIRLAGGDRGPQHSSPLLQDKIAAMIWRDSGSSAWSCA